MKLHDRILPASQDIDAGGMVRLYKALPGADPSYLNTFGGPSPMTGKMIKAVTAPTVVGIEGGYGVCTANAEQYFGIKGRFLRKKVRIDKCPWPDGQQDIRIRCTLNYSQSVGSIPQTSNAPPAVSTLIWPRNTTLSFTLVSGTTPSNTFQSALGFGPGFATANFTLQARGVGVGHPLVQNDGNPYTDTFVTLDVSGVTWVYGDLTYYSPYPPPQTRHHQLPCNQWAAQQVSFPGDSNGFFEVGSFEHGPIGLVMSIDYQITAVGWDTGFDDDMDVQGFEPPH